MDDIKELINSINEYQNEHGEDRVCLVAKAKLFDMLGDYNRSLNFLKAALKYDINDVEILYSIAVELEKLGDLALASVYYANAAIQMKKQDLLDDYNHVLEVFSTFNDECQEIFNTLINNKTGTFIFLSLCGFGVTKQRYQNLAVALAELGNRVIYLNPIINANVGGRVSSDVLADYVISHEAKMEGVHVLQPLFDSISKVNSYSSLILKLSDLYSDSVFLVSNVATYDILKQIKGKNKIIFDCADDNSDYKNAFWSNKEFFDLENKLVDLADGITCTAASLFLKKAVIENKKNVYLSQNAVSATELNCGSKVDEPEDLKGIPHPRIGYVGVIYQRFDREAFYKVVEQNPDKSFVIVGSVMDNYIYKKYDNMYFLGPKAHADLGAYYRNFDICLIPYFDDAKMSMSCDPVKLHEHICCGVPTITTYMPDTAVDRPMVYHGNTVAEIQRHIDNILKNYPKISKDELNAYLVRHSWISRACQYMRIANDSVNEQENKEKTKLKIRYDFDKIKDIHPNYKIIHAITYWNDDYELCKKEIEESYESSQSDYHTEIRKLFNERKLYEGNSKKVTLLNNVNLIDVKDCTGCTSCYNKCPINAITMVPNDLGFLYPKINYELCVNCGECLNHCPLKNSICVGKSSEDSYAIMASNEIRANSSSGGLFTLIASKVIKNGGFVCGAVYDEKFDVKHIVSNKLEDIEKMKGSKYVQSELGEVFQEIKDLLLNKNVVLFTGCPCQVSGLYSYLDDNPQNLLTISLVCAGVPSPEIYNSHKKYLEDSNSKILNLNFRDKTKFGWNTGLSVKFEDGNEYVANVHEDIYLNGFLSGMFLRESCYDCKFKNDIYSDIVLGDYWGIQNILKFEDGLGTSYISANSEKGRKAIKECSLEYLKMAKIPKKHAITLNPRIRSSMPISPFRDKFIDNFMNCKDFHEAYKRTFTDKQFDAVLILWWSSNYGNALTNYALYHSLVKMGLTVLAVDNLTISPNNQFNDFANRYFNLSSLYFPQGSFNYVTKCSNNFIVGSDQVWNKTFSYVMGDSGYFQLSFVPDEKNKISYGSSFGQTSDAVDVNKFDYYKKLYARLDSVSLREQFGVKIMKTYFGIAASYVLDPVFLLQKSDYEVLANKANINMSKRFITTYILTPNEEKKKYILKLQEKLGDVEIINIIDAEPRCRADNISKFNFGKLKTELSPEEFLYYFANSEFVVTDSYHGTCFSMIFEKRFVAFVNRESERFETFKEFLECKKRVISNVPTHISNELLKECDYSNTKKKIDLMRNESFEYLTKALKI